MKKMWGTRVLAMLLVLALTAGLVPAALAANSEASVAFKQVPNDTLDTLIRPDVAVGEIEDAEMGEDTAAYQAHDLVRVSIILEDTSTLEAYSDAAAEGTLAEDAAAVSYRAALQRKQDSIVRKISSTILGREELDVVWNLTLVANLISANVEYGKIEQIKQIPGVADVVLEQQYEPASSENTVQPNMEISTGMTGTTTAWSTGYTGAGMRIAIIDTGLDTSHQSFDNGAYEYALEQNAARAKESVEAYKASLDLLDADEINEKLSLLHIKEGVSAADLYRTEKVAYGYCYIDKDLDVTHETDAEGEHGSHVAGIAAANRYLPDGNGGYVSALDSVHMHGAAPDAQVLVMKVFGDEGGAYDSDYTAAIEDAIVLGADTINLSLGSASPGPSKARTEAYQKIFDDLENASSVVTVSSGNAGYWAKNADPIGYLYSDGVSMQTDGQPGSYANSLTVASVDNDGFIGNYLLIGQEPIAPSETTGFTNKPISTIVGEHEFVFFSEDATKYAVDAAGNNLLLAYADAVKDKIVFVSRGQSSFYQKHDAAAAAGALACVVYNNQSGSINMDLSSSTATIPCVSITQDDGELVRTQAEPVYAEDGTTVLYYTGKIEVRGKEPVRFNRDYKTISEFSSWGVPGDLTLKPEIAAPGGNIYSLNGLHNSTSGMQGGHQDYELMSGTSMAAPQIAGIGALVKQYIESKGLSRSDLTDRALAQSIMMSTAEPVVNNENNAYYPVIQQGAGMVNAAAATSADSYIKMRADATASWADGKVKAELGDDPARTGSYDFSFTVNNLDGRTHAYALSAELFTQALLDYEGQSYMDTLTTPLSAAVTWTVNGRATDSLSRDYDYNNDGRVDLEDGQLLLDVASKKPGAKLLNPKAIADLNGDGAVTAYDAHLFLNLLQEATILVPANGKAEVVCHIRLLDRSALNASYPTGAYVEGYVRVQGLATDEGAAGTSHSIPVLGYYGSWSEPSMYDVGSLIDSIYGTETRAPYLGTTNSYGYTVSNFLNILYAGETESSAMVGNPVDFDDEYQYIPTDLGFQFPYDPNWATLCSLNVADDGELFLTSYSTQGEGASRKESTTLYWLHYDEQANRFRTAIIGSFGDIAPVSVTEVHTNDSTADTQKTSIFEKALRPESLKTAKAQPISQMKAANKQTAGTLNSVSQPQSTGSTSAQRSTVTLDLTAIAPTASSIMEISYNTKELTLSSVTGAATLTSWYESVPGTIVFACAERSEAAVGELLGQLRFELAAGSSSSKVTIKTKQLNETSFAAGQEKIRTVVLGDSLSQILPAIISSGEKDCPSRSFRDLDTTKWYHEAIDTMLREGLMNGTGNGLFEPNGTLTRAMLVTILWRSEGKPAASAQTSFTDVPAGAYYAEAVRWAAANGVVKGVSSTEFGPSKNITRQELVTILWRLAAKKGLNTSNAGLTVPEFADRSQIAAWAAEAMSWGCTRGILTGKSANRVDPTGTATRAEAAAMIVRFRNLGTAGEKQ